MSLRADPSSLRVHQLASDLAVDVDSVARCFRGPGGFARGDQLARAVLSIGSNIAEACGRGTVREFRQFLSYARASAQEALTQIRISRRIDKHLDRRLLALQGRLILAIKMIDRLSVNPPPPR